jgi:translation initiation factor IF-3
MVASEAGLLFADFFHTPFLTSPPQFIDTQRKLESCFSIGVSLGTLMCRVSRINPLLQERVTAIERQQTRINEKIRISPVRLIGADGAQLGIVPTDEALAKARETGQDLVEVAPQAKPPVCRIMDYGKFKYQHKRKQSKGHTHRTKTKEIRLRPKTGEHDIDFKVKRAKQFLGHKDKVQVSVLFRGREMAHVEEGRRVMAGVIEKLSEVGKLESPPQQLGRRIICTIAPK